MEVESTPASFSETKPPRLSGPQPSVEASSRDITPGSRPQPTAPVESISSSSVSDGESSLPNNTQQKTETETGISPDQKNLIRAPAEVVTSSAPKRSWFWGSSSRGSPENAPKSKKSGEKKVAKSGSKGSPKSAEKTGSGEPESDRGKTSENGSGSGFEESPKASTGAKEKSDKIHSRDGPDGERGEEELKPENGAHLDGSEVERLRREKAGLEGRLEMLERENREMLKHHAELQTRAAEGGASARGASSYSSPWSPGAPAGDKDRKTMQVELETIKQNKARLEAVIVDAHRLLEDREREVIM